MPLGNNLKKKTLLPEGNDSGEPKKKRSVSDKKKVTAKAQKTKKVTASSKKTTQPAAKKKPAVVQKKTAPVDQPKKTVTEVLEKVVIEKKSTPSSEENFAESMVGVKLPIYIAKELRERKKTLRKRYQDEIQLLSQKSNIQFVIIVIGSERYAIEIDNIKEIVPITEISKTPNTPSHIKGITNVRGRTYVVFDLADKFKVTGDELPKYLLVLNNKEINSSLTLGVLPSTLKIEGSAISSDLQIIEDALLDASYIKGLIQNGEQLIYYLDIIELIKNEKAIVVPDELLEQVK